MNTRNLYIFAAFALGLSILFALDELLLAIRNGRIIIIPDPAPASAMIEGKVERVDDNVRTNAQPS